MRVAFVLLWVPLAALAKDRVVLDAPAAARGPVVAALKKGCEVVVAKKSLGESPTGAEVKEAAGEAHAKAVVLVRRAGSHFTLLVLDAADGGLIEQLKVKAAGAKPKMSKDADAKLLKAIARAEGPKAEPKPEPRPEPKPEETKPEPKPEPVAEPKPEPKAEPVAQTHPAEAQDETTVSERLETARRGHEAPYALRAAVGGRVFSRRLYWTDDIFNRLAKYDLPAAPMVGGEVDFFPFALMMEGPAANVGLDASFHYAVGLGSQATDQTKYSTTALRLRLGLLGRIPLGALEIRPQAGWVMQSFAIKATTSGAAKPPLPDVAYSNLRFGADVGFKVFGPLALFAGAAYELPLSTGEMGKTYFPRLSVGGFDANAGLSMTFGRIEVRAALDYTRFWYSMNPKPGDPYVAGGALDDYKGASLTVGFLL